MDKNIAIEFENVGKQYRLGLVGTGSLQHDINRWWQTSILGKEDPYLKIGEVNDRSTKGHSDYVWALKDISFKVEQGDVVGIIGKNGAGKSTLLKLLSHITAPSTGHITYKGRLASLLEVGTGFHPEMTARDNIYMNGSIMGMSKSEIDRKLDEIVDFAGIERYIDTPVKRFSSGMSVRLGFAVAAFLEPEILVVDEVLAVGDAEFQKKAIGKMQEVSTGGGRTVLFVSHNMVSIQRLCKHGVFLENGMIKYNGEINTAIQHYLADDIVQSEFEGIDGDESILYLTKVTLRGDDLDGVIRTSSTITIEFDVTIKKKFRSLVCGFNILSSMRHPLARADFNDISQATTLEPGSYHFVFQIPPYSFGNGQYKLTFDIAEKAVKRYTTEKSDITFSIEQSKDNFGNIYAESLPTMSSIFRPKWLKDCIKI